MTKAIEAFTASHKLLITGSFTVVTLTKLELVIICFSETVFLKELFKHLDLFGGRIKLSSKNFILCTLKYRSCVEYPTSKLVNHLIPAHHPPIVAE